MMAILSRLIEPVSEPELEAFRERIERLTPREFEVLRSLIRGETAELAAETFGVARRTVELHRQAILAKLHARNAVDVVRMIALVELADGANN